MSEAELKEYNLQLESVEAALKDDPENPELQSLVAELKEFISLTTDLIAQTGRPAPTSTPPSSTHTPTTRDDPPSTTTTFSVGDPVLARWTSGDNQLYPAKITSVTGSSTNPVYLVKFTQYNVTEQLGAKDIKPSSKGGEKKRKIEETHDSAVISMPAAINPEAAEARRGALEGGEQKPAKKGRKLEQKKVLERGQKKWQEFAAKGVKGKTGKPKKIGESSMFRTPDSVHGRVGFTGSGQPMRKDVARGKHIYAHADDEE